MFEFPPKSETDQSVPSMNLPVPIVAVASWIETRRRNASRDPPADGWSDQREPRVLDCIVRRLPAVAPIVKAACNVNTAAVDSVRSGLNCIATDVVADQDAPWT